MEDRKSIVLITVDCLRADHVGFMGYPRPTTPFLDTLAKQSFVIPTAIVAGAPTYYSLPAILAARYPLALGRDVLGVAPGEPTLASLLRQSGYRTAAFSAANPYISSRFGYAQGFDTFVDFLAEEVPPRKDKVPKSTGVAALNRRLQKICSELGPLRVIYDELYFRYCQRATPVPDSLDVLRRFPSADVIVNRACEWLSSGGEPFLLWLHLMDPHSPYYPKEQALAMMGRRPLTPYRARYLNSYWNRSDVGPSRLGGHFEEIVHLYDAGIRWVDVQLARLVETLRQTQRWDKCIFALTADHGEEFLDHGGRYHPPSRMTEELIHVPLLLRVPGAEKVNVDSSPFSLIHLAPTVLAAAQVPVTNEFRGHSCWNALRDGTKIDEAAISESIASCSNPFHPEHRFGPRALSVRESRFKLVLHFDPPSEQLYDLQSDPGEHAPLAPTAQKPVRRRLLEIARAHLAQSRNDRDLSRRLGAQIRDLQLKWKNPVDNVSPVAS